MAIRLVTNSYSQNKSQQYRISIREHSNGYSFSIVDTAAKECVALAQVDSYKELTEDPLVREDYGEFNIVLDGAPFSLVPEALFVSDNAACYLPISSQHQKRAVVAQTAITDFAMVGLCNRRGCLEFANNSDRVEYTHPLFAMLKQVGHQLRKTVFVDVQKEQMHLLVVDYQKVLLANTFAIQTNEDAFYYLMTAFQSLELDVEKVPVVVSGEVNSQLMDTLKEYIRIVSLASPTTNTLWSRELDANVYAKFSLIV